MRGPVSARRVFTASAAGDPAAAAIVAQEAELVARAVCAIVTVDPEMVVLGGGIGQAPGFAPAVAAELSKLAPAISEVRVSALGTEAVVDGCLAAGAELAWHQLTSLDP
jgi:predicted NBD/HSP70 family sugar kinase